MNALLNHKHVKFDWFTQFEGMTVEYEARKLKNDYYGVTATVRLNGKLFVEYECTAHYTYFSELIYKKGGVQVDVCTNTLNEWAPHISKMMEWDSIWPE